MPNPTSRREFILRALITVCGGALASACAIERSTNDQPTSAPATASRLTPTLDPSLRQPAVANISTVTRTLPPTSAPPRSGGTLRYTTIGEFLTLDPSGISPQTADNIWSVWDRLTAYDSNGEPQPMRF